MEKLTRNTRRHTDEVQIGPVAIGGTNPVAEQSMTDTDTNDIEASVAEIGRLREAGCRIVRLTTQGLREAESMKTIAQKVRSLYPDVALVADVHFQPAVALALAGVVDKVRINPGNYHDRGGEFVALIEKCRATGTAIRIGVNHGSLARHIVEQYGDTPRGMVASAMEFLQVCRERDFGAVVVSMKSSNTRVMVAAYRLLAAEMEAAGMHYPLHLGVTEAGNGIEGRIKSAVGIGALLADGLGDTIRVSLTEPPENEIPVARAIVGYFEERGDAALNITVEGEGHPVVLRKTYSETSPEALAIKAACDFGRPLLDGLADDVCIECEGVTAEQIDEISLAILQAARIKMSRAEFIACPGCGRTLYDLAPTLERIKAATGHLAGLKIGVMGCIVNGPGEMADADYGYVGAGPGRITLYRGQQVVRRDIPQSEALAALLDLLKADGKYGMKNEE
ncbi:MAG: (E)-4-hydroxy-3-methylbut-2-enyl-diphosphate synthase [Rikenellaceae bacterium]|nr:(E)-4-hydroxy-3-methylbut-2-enyl-diphosphate synthase [Rikenellaceae bacterium]